MILLPSSGTGSVLPDPILNASYAVILIPPARPATASPQFVKPETIRMHIVRLRVRNKTLSRRLLNFILQSFLAPSQGDFRVAKFKVYTVARQARIGTLCQHTPAGYFCRFRTVM